jgi:hypothetical protein
MKVVAYHNSQQLLSFDKVGGVALLVDASALVSQT